MLRKRVGITLHETYGEVSKDVRQWKVTDIKLFQEDLMQKVNGRISEKWFYTHFKTDAPSLPRIDILDLLSAYAGYDSWSDFKAKQIPSKEKNKRPVYLLVSGALLLVLILVAIINFIPKRSHEYHFCMIDAYSRQPVEDEDIRIMLLQENQSPYQMTTEKGCLVVLTQNERVQFVIQSPYYKTDTITRVFNTRSGNEHIALQTDDYALMIQMFANGQVENWEKHRKQLEGMIAPEARIYQMHPEGPGMEIYNKQEFIDKLTIPLQSLGRVKLVEIRHENDQIKVLRFIQEDVE